MGLKKLIGMVLCLAMVECLGSQLAEIIYHDSSENLRTLNLSFVYDNLKEIHYGQKIGMTLFNIEVKECMIVSQSSYPNFFAAYISIVDFCGDKIISQVEKLGAQYIFLDQSKMDKESQYLNSFRRKVPVFLINNRQEQIEFSKQKSIYVSMIFLIVP